MVIVENRRTQNTGHKNTIIIVASVMQYDNTRSNNKGYKYKTGKWML